MAMCKVLSIRIYLDELLDGNGKTDASSNAAAILDERGRDYQYRLIRQWANLMINGLELPAGMRGRHPNQNYAFTMKTSGECA